MFRSFLLMSTLKVLHQLSNRVESASALGISTGSFLERIFSVERCGCISHLIPNVEFPPIYRLLSPKYKEL